MSDNKENKTNTSASGEQQYSLNDDRRVKVLSPRASTARLKPFCLRYSAPCGLLIAI